MPNDITITLTLTDFELARLHHLVLTDKIQSGGADDLNGKVDRAIERAESFVDAVDSLGPGGLQDCAGCNGTGIWVDSSYDNAEYKCVECNGTGKEYV